MCAAAVKDTLQSLPGVAEAQIDFDNKKALVAVEEEKFDAAAAMKTLTDKGYATTAGD